MYASRSEGSDRTGFRAGVSLPPARTPALAVDVVALGVVLTAVADPHAPPAKRAFGATL